MPEQPVRDIVFVLPVEKGDGTKYDHALDEIRRLSADLRDGNLGHLVPVMAWGQVDFRYYRSGMYAHILGRVLLVPAFFRFPSPERGLLAVSGGDADT
ncbi:hypothetical protein ACIQU4_26420 [Streptomyces sp. NPDC090741]|uniref:hypothetical protein n=1 Tax=Streptomyces sp. NPDC090741 TaxID=3365967 RepID=UPI00381D817D